MNILTSQRLNRIHRFLVKVYQLFVNRSTRYALPLACAVSASAQVRVPGVLTNGGNSYPVAPVGMISGAPQIVADMTALSNTPSWLRLDGQIFHVMSPASDWRYVGGTNNANLVEVVGGTVTSAANLTNSAGITVDRLISPVASVAALIASPLTNATLYLQTYDGTEETVGAAGHFYHDTSSTPTNLGTVFGSAYGGRWVRNFPNAKKEFDIEWFGTQRITTSIGHDSTREITNCIATAPNGSVVLFPAYDINTTGFDVTNRVGLTLSGKSQSTGYAFEFGGPTIFYIGPTNGHVLGIYNSMSIQVYCLGFAAHNRQQQTTTNIANQGIDIDQFVGGQFITTSLRIGKCKSYTGITNANWKGIAIARTTGDNCEDIVIEDCYLWSRDCGDGIYVGPSANAFNIVAYRNNTRHCVNAYHAGTGLSVFGGLSDGDQVVIHIAPAFLQPAVYSGIRAEQGGYFHAFAIIEGSGDKLVTIENCTIASFVLDVPALIQIQGQVMLKMEGNTFADDLTGTVQVYSVNEGVNNSLDLISKGNFYPHRTFSKYGWMKNDFSSPGTTNNTVFVESHDNNGANGYAGLLLVPQHTTSDPGYGNLLTSIHPVSKTSYPLMAINNSGDLLIFPGNAPNFVRMDGRGITNVTLDQLSDVTITTAAAGHALGYNGTIWTNGPAGAGGGGSLGPIRTNQFTTSNGSVTGAVYFAGSTVQNTNGGTLLIGLTNTGPTFAANQTNSGHMKASGFSTAGDLLVNNISASSGITASSGIGAGEFYYLGGGNGALRFDKPADNILTLDTWSSGNLISFTVKGASAIVHASNFSASNGVRTVSGGYTNKTVAWLAGTGSPEGAVVAAIGSIWSRTDGSTDTATYRKEAGTGNTGWVASTAGGGGITATNTQFSNSVLFATSPTTAKWTRDGSGFTNLASGGSSFDTTVNHNWSGSNYWSGPSRFSYIKAIGNLVAFAEPEPFTPGFFMSPYTDAESLIVQGASNHNTAIPVFGVRPSTGGTSPFRVFVDGHFASVAASAGSQISPYLEVYSGSAPYVRINNTSFKAFHLLSRDNSSFVIRDETAATDRFSISTSGLFTFGSVADPAPAQTLHAADIQTLSADVAGTVWTFDDSGGVGTGGSGGIIWKTGGARTSGTAATVKTNQMYLSPLGALGVANGIFSTNNLPYDATTWNGNLQVPTMDAVRDKIETIGGGSGGSATNAVTTISTNGTALTTAATNLNFWQGANITITGTNQGGLVGLRFDAVGGSTDPRFTSSSGTITAGSNTFAATVLTENGNAVFNSSETPGGELGGTWASPTIDDGVAVATWTLIAPIINGLIDFPDNVRQTFNPGANAASLNVGAIAGDPDTPVNGDLWYDSSANELTARINGANVALGAGGGGSYVPLAGGEMTGPLTNSGLGVSTIIRSNTINTGNTTNTGHMKAATISTPGNLTAQTINSLDTIAASGSIGAGDFLYIGGGNGALRFDKPADNVLTMDTWSSGNLISFTVKGASAIVHASNFSASNGVRTVSGGYTNKTVAWLAGTGSPEGAVVAAIGSIWSRTDGSTDTATYRKEAGTGNTGWVASTAGGGGITATNTQFSNSVLFATSPTTAKWTRDGSGFTNIAGGSSFDLTAYHAFTGSNYFANTTAFGSEIFDSAQVQRLNFLAGAAFEARAEDNSVVLSGNAAAGETALKSPTTSAASIILSEAGTVAINGTVTFGTASFTRARRTQTDLNGGTSLAVGQDYYDQLSGDRTLTFSGTAADGDVISLAVDVSAASPVLTFPTSEVYAGTGATATTVTLWPGTHNLMWKRTGDGAGGSVWIFFGPPPRAFAMSTSAFVIGTRYTNSTARSFVTASFALSAAVAGTAAVSLRCEQGGVTNRVNVSAGPLASLTTTEQLSLMVSPGAFYYFVDDSSGSGATAAIVSGTSSKTDF